jgi:cell division septation protein DedD
MLTTDCATDVAPSDSQNYRSQMDAAEMASGGPSKPLKGLVFGFAAIVTIGLALASWYVGVRIVSADEGVPSGTAATPILTVPGSSPSAAPAPTAAPPAAAKHPPAPEIYLQVAGLGRKQDVRFVRSLEAKGFRARLQGREGQDARILIGPFASHAGLELAQRKLQSTGVLAIETGY